MFHHLLTWLIKIGNASWRTHSHFLHACFLLVTKVSISRHWSANNSAPTSERNNKIDCQSENGFWFSWLTSEKTPPETYYPFTMPFNGHLTVWIRFNAIAYLPVFPLKQWGDLLYSISTQFISSRVIYSAEQGIAWRHVPKCLNLSAMNSFHPFWPCVHSYRNLRSKVSPPKYDEEGGGIGWKETEESQFFYPRNLFESVKR